MSYFRRRFSTFEEFQRETFHEREELGREELEMIAELEAEDDLFEFMTRRRRKSPWD